MRYLMMILMVCGLAGPVLAQDAPPVTPITVENSADLSLAFILSGHEWAVNDLDFSADGTLLASAGSDLTSRLWNPLTGENLVTFEGQLIEVRSVTLSPDATTLLTTGFNGVAFFWDVPSRTRATSIAVDFPLSAGIYTPDGDNVVLAVGDGSVRLFDAASGEETARFPTDAFSVPAVAVSPDGAQIAAGQGFPADAAVIWDRASGERLHTLTGHNNTVYSLAYHPDGTTLATAGGDGTVRLWDATTGEALNVFEGHNGEVFALAYHPDGTLLASAGFDSVVRLWDPTSGTVIRTLTLPTDDPTSVLALAFSPDASTLAAAGQGGDIVLWRVAAP